MKLTTARVISNTEVMPAVYQIWLESASAIEARPGQFVMVRCGQDTLLRRPISIHQQNDNKVSLLFQVVGTGTHWLAERQTGERIDLFGPLGNGFALNSKAQSILLVAGGLGIAPLHFLAQEARKKGSAVKLLCGAKTASLVYPCPELDKKVEILPCSEDGTIGKSGLVTGQLSTHVEWANQIFACGPLGMFKDMFKNQRKYKLENKPIQVSLEVRMGCGYGVCYGCTVKTQNGLKQVCKDGPIFNLNDILWDELG